MGSFERDSIECPACRAFRSMVAGCQEQCGCHTLCAHANMFCAHVIHCAHITALCTRHTPSVHVTHCAHATCPVYTHALCMSRALLVSHILLMSMLCAQDTHSVHMLYPLCACQCSARVTCSVHMLHALCILPMPYAAIVAGVIHHTGTLGSVNPCWHPTGPSGSGSRMGVIGQECMQCPGPAGLCLAWEG